MTKHGNGLRFRLRRGGSKSSRVRRQALSMMPSGRNAPVMALQMASRRILNRRQQWRGWSGGGAERRGGRVQRFGGVVFDEQSGDDVGKQPGSDEIGILGLQPIDMEQALEPLEGNLDLPAQGVELEDLPSRLVERGRHNGVLRGDQAARVWLAAAPRAATPGGFLLDALDLALDRLGRLAPHQQTDRHRLAVGRV